MIVYHWIRHYVNIIQLPLLFQINIPQHDIQVSPTLLIKRCIDVNDHPYVGVWRLSRNTGCWFKTCLFKEDVEAFEDNYQDLVTATTNKVEITRDISSTKRINTTSFKGEMYISINVLDKISKDRRGGFNIKGSEISTFPITEMMDMVN